MATRDRTDAFMQARDRHSHETSLHEMGPPHLLPEEEEECRITVAPGWMTTLSDVEVEIAEIDRRMAELKELHKRHILPGFDSRIDEEQQIEILTKEISSAFYACQKKLQRVAQGTKLSPEQNKVKKNAQSKLALVLQNKSKEFKKHQQVYMRDLRNKEMSGVDEFGVEAGNDDFFKLDTGFNEKQMAQLESEELGSEELVREIQNIATSIRELNELFQSLSTMVVEQGTILDRIDYNLECAEVNMEQAISELRKTEQTIKYTRTMYCMLFLCVMILASLLVLVLKLMITS